MSPSSTDPSHARRVTARKGVRRGVPTRPGRLSATIARALAAVAAVAPAALLPPDALALDIGFEGFAAVIGSDNVEAANSPDEEEGTVGAGVLGVYGEQRGRVVRGAFTGEIDARRRLDDDGDDTDTVTRFLGAAEFALSPRAFRWYVGDILGGVRPDDALQPISEQSERVVRRNVFVTGPSFEHELGRDSRVRSRLLYVDQSEDDRDLESLFNFSLDWQKDTTPGSFYGLSFGDVYTVAGEAVDGVGEEEDFNRASLAGFWNRARGRIELYGRLGATRYDTEEESLNGLAAELRATRALGPSSSASIALTRDLSDQSLSTVESLIDDGSGVEPEADGFFDDTRLSVAWNVSSPVTSAEAGAGISHRDYRLLAAGGAATADADDQDQDQAFAYAALSRALTPRLRAEGAVRYERQSYENRDDESDSVLASLRLLYRLSRSFELEGSYTLDRADGTRSRLGPDGALAGESIDVTENRVSLGIRWAPPSRASRDLTIELKSLLR